LGKIETKEKREEKGVRDYCIGKGKNEKKRSGDYQLQGFLQLEDRQNFDLSHYFPQRGSSESASKRK
jgi:hypothetical protein